MLLRIAPSKLKGKITVQPSKSDSHRKLICAAFANGVSTVDNVSLSEDINATLRCVSAAGASYDISDSVVYPGRKLIGIKGTAGTCLEIRTADCGESGSTLRFMSMIFSAAGGQTELTGHGRLPFRPLNGAMSLFERNNIAYTYPGEGCFLPLTIDGELYSGKHEVDSSVTSQYLSGLLMGLPAFSKHGLIKATGKFESRGYVDVTIEAVRQFGIRIKGNNPYIVPENNGLTAIDTSVEGDWSNASYFLVMQALGSDLEITGLNPASLQPDAVILKNIQLVRDSESPVIDVSECPDIMPSLAVLGAAMDKTLKITGGRRLRAKESDRIKSVAAGLAGLGIKYKEVDDGIEIYGNGKVPGGEINAFNDHRIAMAFASLCVVSKRDIVINGADSVSKSYPLFYEDLRKLGGIII